MSRSVTTDAAGQSIAFCNRQDAKTVETGDVFMPKFDADGLIPAIVTDAKTGGVLMFAHMDAQALALTIDTGEAHFYSRSRQRLWKKGEESGNVLEITDMRTDCDQDVLWLTARVRGEGVACHTGAPSCFYRRIVTGADRSSPVRLTRI